MENESRVVKPIVFTECKDNVAGASAAGGNQASFDVLIGKAKALCQGIREWYASPSEAYSTIVGQEITPKGIVRVNVLTVLVIVLCLCASKELVVTGVTTACVGWIVYNAKGSMPNNPNGNTKEEGEA